MCRREESNFRPQPYEDFALTAELRRHGNHPDPQIKTRLVSYVAPLLFFRYG